MRCSNLGSYATLAIGLAVLTYAMANGAQDVVRPKIHSVFALSRLNSVARVEEIPVQQLRASDLDRAIDAVDLRVSAGAPGAVELRNGLIRVQLDGLVSRDTAAQLSGLMGNHTPTVAHFALLPCTAVAGGCAVAN